MRIIRLAPAADNCSATHSDSHPEQYPLTRQRDRFSNDHIHPGPAHLARVDRHL